MPATRNFRWRSQENNQDKTDENQKIIKHGKISGREKYITQKAV